jgi:hypothetical protein
MSIRVRVDGGVLSAHNYPGCFLVFLTEAIANKLDRKCVGMRVGERYWYREGPRKKELMTISHIDLNCAGIYGDATTNEWAVITQHQEGATQSLLSTPTFEKPNPQRKKGPAKMEKKTEPSGRI